MSALVIFTSSEGRFKVGWSNQEEGENCMEIKINLTLAAVNATTHLLQNTEPKGRVECRSHSRIVKALIKECNEKESTVGPGGRIQESTKNKEGMIIIDSKEFEFLKENVDKKIKSGIPGYLSEGYMDLWDTIEVSEKEIEKAGLIKDAEEASKK